MRYLDLKHHICGRKQGRSRLTVKRKTEQRTVKAAEAADNMWHNWEMFYECVSPLNYLLLKICRQVGRISAASFLFSRPVTVSAVVLMIPQNLMTAPFPKHEQNKSRQVSCMFWERRRSLRKGHSSLRKGHGSEGPNLSRNRTSAQVYSLWNQSLKGELHWKTFLYKGTL